MPVEEDKDIGLLAFRLDQIEKSIENFDKKLDQLLTKQESYVVEVALLKAGQKVHEARINAVETKSELVQKTTSDLQISLAQKIGPGAAAGGVVALISFVIKTIMGG